MSEYEYEAVEINDYDLRRSRRKMRKNQQFFEMWTDSDSDSEVEMTFRRVKRRGTVNFVSSGIQQSGDFEVGEKVKDGNNQATGEEGDHPAHRGQEGNGFSNISSAEAAKPQRMSLNSNHIGEWEQHTKGIGAKLLLQMGYKPGKGLGKDLQGTAQPVQAHMRIGRGAIGAYGPETRGFVGDNVPKKQKDIHEAKEFNDKLNKWKTDDSKKVSSKKNRYYYRSAEEVIEKGKKSCEILPDKISRKLGNVPVIDLTSPEKPFVSGYHALGQTKIIDEDLYHIQTANKPTDFDLADLIQDIIALEKTEREASEKQKALDHEGRNPEKIARLEKDHTDTLEQLSNFKLTVNAWNPKMHQKMAALLGSWAPLLPTSMLENVLEQLILPRLVGGVNEWDPLADTIPMHSWILPWSTVLGYKMEEYIYPTIREKLGNALQAWVPQDRSASAVLLPWKGAFDAADMQTFLLKHIIPKLQMALSKIVINPLQQDLEIWNQVWEWNELIPPLLMGQILDKYFFPKWMQVLVLWLNQSPDFDQISRWYTGWKTLLGGELLKQPLIKEHLRRALEIMHWTTEKVYAPQPTPASSLRLPALTDLQITHPSQLEFKELVSRKCAECGIIFAPMPGRREFGKQVYRVGKLFCFIDCNVVMLSDRGLKNWTPTSLGLTIQRAVYG